jgi:hypothetical protein
VGTSEAGSFNPGLTGGERMNERGGIDYRPFFVRPPFYKKIIAVTLLDMSYKVMTYSDTFIGLRGKHAALYITIL